MSNSLIPITGTPLVWFYMENNTVVNKFAQNVPNYGTNVFEVYYRPSDYDTTSFSSSNTKFGPQSLYLGIKGGGYWSKSRATSLQCTDNNPIVLDKEFTIKIAHL